MALRTASRREDPIGPSRDRQGAEAGRAPAPPTQWSSAALRTAHVSKRAPARRASSTASRMALRTASRREDPIGPSRDRQGAEAGRAPAPPTQWSSAALRTAHGSKRAPARGASSTASRMALRAASRREDPIGPSRDRQGAEAGRAPAPPTQWSSAALRTAHVSKRAPARRASSTASRMALRTASRREDPIGPSRDRQGVNHGPAGRQSGGSRTPCPSLRT